MSTILPCSRRMRDRPRMFLQDTQGSALPSSSPSTTHKLPMAPLEWEPVFEEPASEELQARVRGAQKPWALKPCALNWGTESIHGCQSGICAFTWTSKMAKIMDPILPILSILGYWAIILGSFGGPGTCALCVHACNHSCICWPCPSQNSHVGSGQYYS